MATDPRGIRNHNPGNIRKSRDKWQGLAAEQTDSAFFRFSSPVYGIRALARVLINYQDKHGLSTVRKIIARWAPPNENNTDAYALAVAKDTGFTRDQELDLHDYAHLEPLVRAIIRHENGQQPYSQAVIDKALVLAGVEPPAKPSRTIRAGLTGAPSLMGAGGLEAVQDVLSEAQGPIADLSVYLDVAKYALLAISLLSLGVMIWARLDDKRRGLR